MNKFQRDDLNFIMYLDEEGWQEFLNTSQPEDLLYALELISLAQAENQVLLIEAQEEKQDTDGLDCSLALEFINRVKKGASK